MIAYRVVLRTRVTPRALRTVMSQGLKRGWQEAGRYTHEYLAQKRFSKSHAAAAGYRPRKPAYEAKKLARMGHSRPLEYSGRTRLGSYTARASATSKGVKVFYPGLRGLNRRNPASEINMREEFERVLPKETEQVATVIDNWLDVAIKNAGTAPEATYRFE